MRVRSMGVALLVALAVVGCSSNSGTTTTGQGVPAGTSAAGVSSGAGGVNPAPTVGSGGAATGNGSSGATGGSVGGSTTGTPGSSTSGISGGAGNPTRIPAPNLDASPSSVAATQTINVQLTAANQDQPSSIDVPRGATVVWTNTSQTNHTVTDDPSKAANASDAGLPNGADAWDSGPLGPGATFSHIFNTPGQYTYFCAIHETQGMVGHITVSS